MSTSGCRLSLSNERKRFQEMIALVWRVDQDAFGGILSGLDSIYASIYRKMQTVSPVRHVWSSFKFRHRPYITSQERNASLL